MGENEIANGQKHELAKDLGAVEALTIGIGTMIGAGIFVLPGIVAQKAGPAAVISFMVGGIVALLVALSLSELATGMPKSGGSYYYINRALGPFFGSIVGYGMWFGLIFATAFYMIGFGRYLAFFFTVPEKLGAAIMFLILAAINYIGAKATGRAQNIIVISLIIILSIFVVWGAFNVDAYLLKPFAPFGWSPLVGLAGLLFITYCGFEVIATVGEEIKNPKKNIPLTMIGSIVFTGVLYVIVMVVCTGIIPYGKLGGYTAAVAAVAETFSGPAGALVMVIGALLATVSSANASILSASRVNFAMGRDKLVSGWLNAIHPKFLTPHRSIFVTSAIILILIWIGEVEFLASVAGLLFLMGHALVHISCLVMRKADLDWYKPKFKSPGYPWVQIIGALSCVAIITRMELSAQVAGSVFVLGGASWYFFWVRTRTSMEGAFGRVLTVARAPKVETAVLAGRGKISSEEYTVLVALSRPEQERLLIPIAAAIAKKHKGEVLMVNVIPVPLQTALAAARDYFKKRDFPHTKILERTAIEMGEKFGVDIKTRSILSHDISKTILNIAAIEDCELLMLGWRGWTKRRGAIMGSTIDPIVNNAPCDVVVVKAGPFTQLKKVLLPTAGGPQLELAGDVAVALEKQFRSKTTAIHVVSSEEEKEAGEKRLSDYLKQTKIKNASEKILISRSPVSAIIKEAAETYGVVVIGATREGLFQQLMFGTIPEGIAKGTDKPVIMVKKFEGAVASFIKKLAGTIGIRAKNNEVQ